jgi:hypothetical protein
MQNESWLTAGYGAEAIFRTLRKARKSNKGRIYAGANGETARQIAEAPRFPLPTGRLDEAFRALQASTSHRG